MLFYEFLVFLSVARPGLFFWLSNGLAAASCWFSWVLIELCGAKLPIPIPNSVKSAYSCSPKRFISSTANETIPNGVDLMEIHAFNPTPDLKLLHSLMHYVTSFCFHFQTLIETLIQAPLDLLVQKGLWEELSKSSAVVTVNFLPFSRRGWVSKSKRAVARCQSSLWLRFISRKQKKLLSPLRRLSFR